MDGWRARAVEVRERGFDAIKFDLDNVVYDLLRERANRTLPNKAIRRMIEGIYQMAQRSSPQNSLT